MKKPWALQRLLIVTVCLLLEGCAFRRLIYSNLDWLAVRQADSYFDLSSAQEDKLRQTVQEEIAWFHAERLQEVIDLLDYLALQSRQGKVSLLVAGKAREDLQRWGKELAERLLPTVSELLSSLSREQWDHFRDELEELNENLAATLAKDGQARDKALRKLNEKQLESLEFWFGSFNDQQVEQLLPLVAWSEEELKERLVQRRRLQTYLIEQLRGKNQKDLIDALRRFHTVEHGWDDPAYQGYRRKMGARWENFHKVLPQYLTEEQNLHYQERLQEIKGDLLDYSKKSAM